MVRTPSRATSALLASRGAIVVRTMVLDRGGRLGAPPSALPACMGATWASGSPKSPQSAALVLACIGHAGQYAKPAP